MNIITVKNPYETKETSEVKGKVIRKAQIARQLLQRGARIIDLKPDRDDPDHKRSVYIFQQDDDFERIFSELIEENRKNRRTNEESAMQQEIEALKRQIEVLQKSASAKEEVNDA